MDTAKTWDVNWTDFRFGSRTLKAEARTDVSRPGLHLAPVLLRGERGALYALVRTDEGSAAFHALNLRTGKADLRCVWFVRPMAPVDGVMQFDIRRVGHAECPLRPTPFMFGNASRAGALPAAA